MKMEGGTGDGRDDRPSRGRGHSGHGAYRIQASVPAPVWPSDRSGKRRSGRRQNSPRSGSDSAGGGFLGGDRGGSLAPGEEVDRAGRRAHHRHRRGRSLRRASAGFRGYARVVYRLPAEIRQTLRPNGRGCKDRYREIYRRSSRRYFPDPSIPIPVPKGTPPHPKRNHENRHDA